MPNWSDGEGGCDCCGGSKAKLGYHRQGCHGCISGPADSYGKTEETRLNEHSSLYIKQIIEACFKDKTSCNFTKKFMETRLAAAFEAGWNAAK